MHNVHVHLASADTPKVPIAHSAMTVYARAMIDEPTMIPGPKLAEQRRGYGVTRRALAGQLGLHRNTVRAWETAPSVDVLRQRRYLTALRALVDNLGHVA